MMNWRIDNLSDGATPSSGFVRANRANAIRKAKGLCGLTGYKGRARWTNDDCEWRGEHGKHVLLRLA